MPRIPKEPEFEVEGALPDPDDDQPAPSLDARDARRRASDKPDADGSLDGPRDDAPDDEDGADDEDEDGADKDDKGGFSDDEINKIRQGIKALKWIPWPTAPGKRVCMRPLSRQETYQGAAAALQALEDVGLTKDDIFEEIIRPDGSKIVVRWLDLAQRDEWLAIALRRADDPKRPLFNTADEMRRRLTSPEIGKLYDILADHMMTTVPLTIAERLGNEEAWVEIVNSLKKKPGEILLAALPQGTLRELVIFMVHKYVT